MALAGALGASAVVESGGDVAVLVGALLAVLLLCLALAAGRSVPIAFAVMALGAIFVLPDGPGGIGLPFYAAGLLLMAELAWWSLDERGSGSVPADVLVTRLLAILGTAAAVIPASALVLAAADAEVSRSPALTAVGAAAIVACAALLLALARRQPAS